MLASEPSDGWTTAQVAPTANRSHAQRLVVIAVVVLGSRSAAVFAAEGSRRRKQASRSSLRNSLMGYVLSGTRAVGRIGSAAGLALVASGSAADQLNKAACAAGEALLHGSNLGRLACIAKRAVQPLQRRVTGIRNLSAHKLRNPRMAYARGLGNARPIAAAALQPRADFGIEFGVGLCAHAASIAIFCEYGKQHFANQG